MADPVIDEIKQRVDIADLVGSRVALKKAGRTLKGLCPFHDEKTPSFVVYPDQGSYHCFGCGKSGDAFTWLQETEHLDFGEALRQLAQRAGVDLPERRRDPQATEKRQRLLAALNEAAAFYHRQLLEARTPEAQAARKYVESRGLTAATVERFGLGYAPDRWDVLLKHLRQRRHAPELAVEAGLLREGERDGSRYDLFRGRLLFPIRDAGGAVIGFGGRILGDGQPKYLNSPQTPLFDKSTVLYGLDQARQAIRREEQAIIVEGYMDAVIAHQHGYTNVVAALGTALTEQQAEPFRPPKPGWKEPLARAGPTEQQVHQLGRYSKNVVLALDADSAGQAATLRGLGVVHEALGADALPIPDARGLIRYEQVFQGEIRIAALPAGRDPDDVIRADPQQWEALIEQAKPIVEFAIDAAVAGADLTNAREKSAVASSLFPLVGAISDRIARDRYLDLLAERLEVDKRNVYAAMAASRWGKPRRSNRQRRREPPPSDEADALALLEQPRAGSPEALEKLERHCLIALLSAPDLLADLVYRPTEADFRRPEYREIYRAVAQGTTRPPDSVQPAAGELTATAIRATLDESLRLHFDKLVEHIAKSPPTTSSQRQADLIQVTLRLREEALKEMQRRVQAQLAAAQQPDDLSELLRRQVELHNDLNRVQLARSRPPLYTAAPA